MKLATSPATTVENSTTFKSGGGGGVGAGGGDGAGLATGDDGELSDCKDAARIPIPAPPAMTAAPIRTNAPTNIPKLHPFGEVFAFCPSPTGAVLRSE